LQAVAEVGGKAGSDRLLLEEVRIALRRVICSKVADNEGVIEGFVVDPTIDLALIGVEKDGQPLDPQWVNDIIVGLEQAASAKPILVSSRRSRALIRDCFAARGVRAIFLAHEEISDEFTLKNIGLLGQLDESRSAAVMDHLVA
jgi:flagellar biosynthesis component FlhA